MADGTGIWMPRSAWDGIAISGKHGAETTSPGVVIEAITGRSAATLMISERTRDRFIAAMQDNFSIAPPDRPRRETGDGIALVWAGPDQWLAVSDDRTVAVMLAQKLAGIAAVSDQSDARAMLKLQGPRVREALAKGCMIDLHPRAFKTGDAALTQIAHMGVHLWQVDDSPVYELAVFRSMAASFASWLFSSSAEYGYEVRPES